MVSGGADMRVKIWSLTNENSRIENETLIGHRSRINDVCALNERHVLSASNDGSILLWDVTKGQAISKMGELNGVSIDALTLKGSSTVACACSDGFIRMYQLNQPDQVLHQMAIDAPVSAICALHSAQQLVYGTEQSTIGIYDLRQMNGMGMSTWKEQRGKINCIIASRDQDGIVVTTADGSCLEYSQEELNATPEMIQLHVNDYTGADDAVLNAKVFQQHLYTICRDRLVRIYDHHAESN
jgi:WD40 repeat protein